MQQQNIDEAKDLIDQRFVQMQRVLSLTTKQTAESRANYLLTSHDEMVKGKMIMDKLRAVVEEIKTEEQRLLKIRTDEQETYIKYAPVMVIFAALISVLISVLAYFRIKADLDMRVQKQKEDEELYIATGKRIAEIEKVTSVIAAGDYTVRSKDEAKDELGRISAALNDMVVSLETNFAELERRNWLQSGSVVLSNAVRGERFVKKMAQKILSHLSAYLNAQVATLYIADSNLNLRLRGGYAITNAPDEIPPGEGFVGQAMQNGKMIVAENLPANYLSIASSIGSTQPVAAIVLPLVYDNNIVGVIELGMLRKPNETELTFLRDNEEALAIALNTALNYERIQTLLEETQAQSEELQSQHNELENINAELEMQTAKLQASEEELRVQQEELQQANRELEERSSMLEERNQLILERNLDVQRKAEELELSTKYKSEFLANMSHELRTPLNSILLLSRLLADNSTNNLDTDQVEYARVIQSSGNGLLTLIDEILDLSKIEAGKMDLEYERVTVKEIAEDMRSLFEPMANDKKIGFKIETDDYVVPEFDTDKLRLEQVLKNLLSNALKFTKTGSITLKMANNVKDGYIDFSVTDTGIGIAPGKQKLIFEAFQQADGSTRRNYGGTGLGLSISRQLARLLGGDIALESVEGKGSRFTLTVPVSEERIVVTQIDKAEEIHEDIMPAEKAVVKDESYNSKYVASNIPDALPDDRYTVKQGDKAILIVEDDMNFARSLLEFTRKKGYKAILSVRGDEGLELARKYQPIGILLDVQLPVKSGLQVMDELKADPRTRHIPVHMMSSHSLKKESLTKGAIDFIDKPFAFEQMQDVFNKLEHVLNRTTKKVLIVEDNPIHAKALSYFLETFNINSDIKNTISESIAALKKDTDCVILDMGIPDAKSYETLEQIKEDPSLEGLPIIVFTGKSLSMAEEQKIKKYADSIVVKTAHSYQRILDEVSIFLHLMEENTKPVHSSYTKRLGILNDVLKQKTVLVVDDDVRNIFSLTKTLEKANMNTIAAIDGKEAIEKLNEHKNIDIVLLDMMMPQMDGYETATRIREHPEWRSLPVIAVTAKAMTGDREKCIKAGASDYITKPVDLDQLLSLLRVWLYEKTSSAANG